MYVDGWNSVPELCWYLFFFFFFFFFVYIFSHFYVGSMFLASFLHMFRSHTPSLNKPLDLRSSLMQSIHLRFAKSHMTDLKFHFEAMNSEDSPVIPEESHQERTQIIEKTFLDLATLKTSLDDLQITREKNVWETSDKKVEASDHSDGLERATMDRDTVKEILEGRIPMKGLPCDEDKSGNCPDEGHEAEEVVTRENVVSDWYRDILLLTDVEGNSNNEKRTLVEKKKKEEEGGDLEEEVIKR
ncbi:hypothetical protein SK128_006887, partial [Halocaridina rubra]